LFSRVEGGDWRAVWRLVVEEETLRVGDLGDAGGGDCETAWGGEARGRKSYGMCCRIAVRRCWRRGLGVRKFKYARERKGERRKVMRGAVESPLLDAMKCHLSRGSYARLVDIDSAINAGLASPELLQALPFPQIFQGLRHPFFGCTYICLSLPNLVIIFSARVHIFHHRWI
jgi:hypothetical protein